MEPLCVATSRLVDPLEIWLSSGGTVVMANPDASPATILDNDQHQESGMLPVNSPSGNNDEPVEGRKHHHAADNIQETGDLDAPGSLHSL